MVATTPLAEIADLPVVNILDNRIHLIDSETTTDYIEDWISHPATRPKTVVVTGFHGLHVATEDPTFKKITDQADLFIPDGIAPVWIARRLGKEVKGRATGADLMRSFFERANEKGYSSYFFGDTDETLDKLETVLKKKYPGHRIVGSYSPPFRQHSDEEKQQMIDHINQTQPDVLWVGLGLPKQERWIYQNRHKLKVPVTIGVGAAFGFHSGKVKRVPQWVGDAGFEWAWRLLAEPKKLWRRDVVDGPRFIVKVVQQWTQLKKDNI